MKLLLSLSVRITDDFRVKQVCSIFCSPLAPLVLPFAENPWMSSPGLNCSVVSSRFQCVPDHLQLLAAVYTEL